MAAITAMIPRQPIGSASTPPSNGATTGAKPVIVIMMLRAPAACLDWALSSTIARLSTMPALPANPIRRRAPISTSIFGEKTAIKHATTYRVSPANSGLRRPMRSERGPKNTCPSPEPIRNVVKVSCTVDDWAARSLTMAGIAGRYRSVDSGATPAISAKAISVGAARVLASSAVAVELVSVAEATAPAVEITEAESLAPVPSVLKRDCVVSAPSGDDTDLRECVT